MKNRRDDQYFTIVGPMSEFTGINQLINVIWLWRIWSFIYDTNGHSQDIRDIDGWMDGHFPTKKSRKLQRGASELSIKLICDYHLFNKFIAIMSFGTYMIVSTDHNCAQTCLIFTNFSCNLSYTIKRLCHKFVACYLNYHVNF